MPEEHRPQLTGQFHDEFIFRVKKEKKDVLKAGVQAAIISTDKKMKLNVDLACDIQFGSNYADIHWCLD